MALERLAIVITGDADGAVKAFERVGNSAEKELKKVDGGLDKFATRMQVGGAAAVGLAAVAIPQLAKLGNAAGNLGETINKSNVIFGESAGEIEKFGSSAARNLGLSKTAAIDAAATFGTLFTNIGKSSEDAAAMSIKLTQLSGDLASFSNAKPEEAVAALGAALRGESEPIRRFGVLLDDATLKQRALSLAIYDGTGSLTPAQRAQAAYAEILAQTSKQQGDFARTSGSLANQQRIAKAEFENLKATIGQGVLPAMTSLYSTTNDLLGVFTRLPVGVQAGVGTFATFTAAGLGAAGTIATTAGTILRSREQISGALFKIGDDGEKSFTRLGKAAVGAGAVFAALSIAQTIKSINDAAGRELDKLAAKFDEATNEQLLEAQRRLSLIGKETEVFDRVLKGSVDTAERFAQALRDAGVDTYDFDVKIAKARANEKQFKTDTDSAAKSTEKLGLAFDASGRIVRDSLGPIDKYGNAIDKVGDEAKDAAPPVLELKEAQKLLKGQMDDTRKIMDDLNKEVSDYAGFLDRILDDTYKLSRADSDWNTALSELQETVAKNGPVWDIWTQKGIENNRALQETIEKVGEYIGVLGEDYPGTVDQFRTESGRFITELAAQATALGVPRGELDKMLSLLTSLQAHQEINIRVKATVYTRQELNDIGAADPVLANDILNGGSRDSGGGGAAGRSYRIGTKEYFIPNTGGTFVPLHGADSAPVRIQPRFGGSTTVAERAQPIHVTVIQELDGKVLSKAVQDYANSVGGITVRTRPRS